MRQQKIAITLAAIALLLAGIAPLTAGPAIPLLDRICIDEFITAKLPVRKWIPVGCEVIDCCPGCPGPPLDWRILVAGDPLASVTLKFENLPPEVRQRLALKGNAQWIDNTTLQVGKGETILSGFDPSPKNGVVPVAIPQFNADQGFVERNKAAVAAAAPDGAADAPADLGRFSLDIEQRIGSVIVNEARFATTLRPCGPFPPPPTPLPLQDRVRLNSNTSGDNAVVLLDGRRSAGCTNDQIFRTTGTVSVGSVLANGACNAETFVFSDDNAMAAVVPSTSWTDPLGNQQTVNLAAMWTVPTTVWVMRGPFATTRARVLADFARANLLYNTMNCGIRFSAPVINDATADPDTPGLLNSACGTSGDLRSRIGFTAGRLNIYYLNDPGARGWWCGNNTIIIGAGADNESLTHEIGHAFTLGHTNGVAGMGATNIMVTGGTGRDHFTIAQCFRCNLNGGSTLNSNGIRTGPTRNCPDGTTNAQCPQLSLDATPR